MYFTKTRGRGWNYKIKFHHAERTGGNYISQTQKDNTFCIHEQQWHSHPNISTCKLIHNY
jgi:hypothetical protein